MKKIVRLIALGGMMVALSGCSTKLKMPWDPDPLDYSNVEIREPLRIPPDLDIIPEPGKDPAKQVEERYGISTAKTAGAILFGKPEWVENPEVQRTRQEELPNWIGEGAVADEEKK